MNKMLADKVAIVTAAGSGIGEAAAIVFAREGAKVVVADVDPKGGEATVSQIRQSGGDAIFVQVDVSREEEVVRMVDTTLKTYGHLDCAFNNAGVGNKPTITTELTEADWHRVLNICLIGTWLCIKHQIPHMLKNGGAIVNTSSNAGLRGLEGMGPYVAAKAGVLGLTRTAALEYASQGIRVNAICPGLINSPHIRAAGGRDGVDWSKRVKLPMGRPGEPAEVAELAAWLCSPLASYLNGQSISVDGGSSAA
jgi:NAD(P)-dependent dehydrogenase (short-subunit alcohol dehydrogenase family)